MQVCEIINFIYNVIYRMFNLYEKRKLESRAKLVRSVPPRDPIRLCIMKAT